MPQNPDSKSQKFNKVLPPIRCTEQEKNKIYEQSLKAGLSLSEYIRQMALNGKIMVKQSDVDFETVQQLRKIGVNINQQTKKLNATGKVNYELTNLWKKLDGLLDTIIKKI